MASRQLPTRKCLEYGQGGQFPDSRKAGARQLRLHHLNQLPPTDYVRQNIRFDFHDCVPPRIAKSPSRSATAAAFDKLSPPPAPLRQDILIWNTHCRRIIGFTHCLLDLATKPCVMFARLLLTLDEIAHEFTYDLRSWPIHSLRRRQKLITKIGFQFHRKYGVLTHGILHCQVMMKYIRCQYLSANQAQGAPVLFNMLADMRVGPAFASQCPTPSPQGGIQR